MLMTDGKVRRQAEAGFEAFSRSVDAFLCSWHAAVLEEPSRQGWESGNLDYKACN